ncbi:MAG: hypothetical protein MK081_08900 [Flavobacteriales bacterium]|nr:hypothetical protein [Flavobacteriales bacterium]
MIELNLGTNVLKLATVEGEWTNTRSEKVFHSEDSQVHNDLTPGPFRIEVSLFHENQLTEQIFLVGCRSNKRSFIELEQFIVLGDKLVVYFDGCILAFDISNLNFCWRINEFEIFGLYIFENDLIVYDELSVLRIDKEGVIKWRYSGMDHFVSYKGNTAFEMNEDHIQLRDSFENIYRIDYDGNVIDDSDARSVMATLSKSRKKRFFSINPFKR